MAEKRYQIELTDTDAFWIIQTMWEAIQKQALFPGREKEVSEAYNKILNVLKLEGGTPKTIQMFAHEEGIKAWYDGKSPYQFFEEHPELLTPVPEG